MNATRWYLLSLVTLGQRRRCPPWGKQCPLRLGQPAAARKRPHRSPISPAIGAIRPISGFEPPLSGPGPVDEQVTAAQRREQPLGDYSNPILKSLCGNR
jgi:hypothetical protein